MSNPWGIPTKNGHVLATADLVDCVPTEQLIHQLPADEIEYGFYGPGRYGWKLENVRPIQSFPLSGKLGLWSASHVLESLDGPHVTAVAGSGLHQVAGR
jgi:hypothetical protein